MWISWKNQRHRHEEANEDEDRNRSLSVLLFYHDVVTSCCLTSELLLYVR
jgi:hypothetical protein